MGKVIFALIVFSSCISFANDATTTEESVKSSSNNSFRSFSQYDFKSCESFSGQRLSSALTNGTYGDYSAGFYDALQSSVERVIQNSIDQAQYVLECLTGKPLKGCSENKKKFLSENQTALEKLRINGQLDSGNLKIRTEGNVNKDTFLEIDKRLRYQGTRQKISGLTDNEARRYRELVDKIDRESQQIVIEGSQYKQCIVKRKGQFILKNNHFCTEMHRGPLRTRLREHYTKYWGAGLEETDRLLLKYPWLKKHNGPKVESELVAFGISEQIQVMRSKLREVQALRGEELNALAAYGPLVDGVISHQQDPLVKEAFCSIAQTQYKRAKNWKLAKNLGLFGIALMGLALCPFTSGVTCLAIGAAGVGAEAAYIYETFDSYKSASSDYSSGLIDQDEFISRRREFENSLAMASVAAAGPVFSGVKGAAGVLRSENAGEAIKSMLSGSRLRNAVNYLRGNSRASTESNKLYTNINKLAAEKPGHLPDELATSIKEVTTKVLGDIHPTNNLRFVSDFDDLVGQLSRVKKGSAEYKELMTRIQLRTKALEAIYKNTKPGPFVQRVQEAIAKSDIPPAIRRDVERCFVTSTRSTGLNLENLFLNRAYAMRADKYCDIPVARVLEKQDSEGWVTLPNGDRQRFLIEKWDCDDCGTSEIPAWVKVMRANDKEDLAQVTHCPNCGNAKESHEKYYGNWEYGSRGQITNATADDVVGAGPGRAKAQEAGKSDETYCGFCGTVHETTSARCGSCGAPSVKHLSNTDTAGVRQAPHHPRNQPGSAMRSGNGRNASRRSDDNGGSSDATGGGGNGLLYAGGATAAVAAGGGAYYFLKGEEVQATVTGMNWKHTVTLEKRVVVNKEIGDLAFHLLDSMLETVEMSLVTISRLLVAPRLTRSQVHVQLLALMELPLKLVHLTQLERELYIVMNLFIGQDVIIVFMNGFMQTVGPYPVLFQKALVCHGRL